MTTFKLTQSEIIARIERCANAYDHSAPMLRDLLMHDLTFPNDYHPTDTDRDALIADIDDAIAANDLTERFERFPHMRTNALEMLDYLLLLNRESITELRLNDSLCPLHAHDYAICFDDASCLDRDDPTSIAAFAYTDDCAMIRLIHPSHDT